MTHAVKLQQTQNSYGSEQETRTDITWVTKSFMAEFNEHKSNTAIDMSAITVTTSILITHSNHTYNIYFQYFYNKIVS